MILFFIILSVFDLIGLGLIAPFISLIVSSDITTFYFFKDLLNQFGIMVDKDGLIILIGVSIIIMFFSKSCIWNINKYYDSKIWLESTNKGQS